MRKILMVPTILVILALAGCVTKPLYTPAPTPTPIPSPIPPTPTPIPNPIPPTPTPQPPDPAPTPTPTSAMDRAMYESIALGTTLTQFKTTIPQNPVLNIGQPDGGVMLRYPLLDSDGQWRQRYANFVFSGQGILTRKPIS